MIKMWYKALKLKKLTTVHWTNDFTKKKKSRSLLAKKVETNISIKELRNSDHPRIEFTEECNVSLYFLSLYNRKELYLLTATSSIHNKNAHQRSHRYKDIWTETSNILKPIFELGFPSIQSQLVPLNIQQCQNLTYSVAHGPSVAHNHLSISDFNY